MDTLELLIVAFRRDSITELWSSGWQSTAVPGSLNSILSEMSDAGWALVTMSPEPSTPDKPDIENYRGIFKRHQS